jgi:hypothetical protein
MRQRYHLYLNGKFYGSGPIGYMHELIANCLVGNGMYGKDDVTFRVVTAEISREEHRRKKNE